MPTERQQLETMLTRAGITFRTEGAEISVHANDNDKRAGLSPGNRGFFADFTFDRHGALIQVSSWE